jgi:hypothetical protein
LRSVVLTLVLVFIAILTALTVFDVVTYGLSPLDVLAVMILALFATGIIGALREPPQE